VDKAGIIGLTVPFFGIIASRAVGRHWFRVRGWVGGNRLGASAYHAPHSCMHCVTALLLSALSQPSPLSQLPVLCLLPLDGNPTKAKTQSAVMRS